MSDMQFDIGQRVNRREDRATVGAIVLQIGDEGEEPSYLIGYDEGGEGWWPEQSLQPA